MDSRQFDRFTRIVAMRINRRTVAKLLPGTLLATVVATRGAVAQGDCEEGEISCRGICVDPLTNPIFCGDCDTTCATGACAGGVCVSCEEIGLNSCPAGNDSFYCTDLQTDPFNCGACAEGSDENFCASGVCVDGACVSTVECEPGLTECSGQCVDLMNDVSHCGGCFRECYGGESEPGVCIEGSCVQCEELGLSFCDGVSEGSYDPYCADFATDPNNCGGCGVVCADGACTDGNCAGAPDPVDDAFTDTAEALSFALELDRLSLELLRYGLETLPRADFEATSPGSRALLSTMRVHDRDHVARLTELLDDQGGTTPQAPAYAFDEIDRVDAFVEALRNVKEAIVSAHLAIIASIDDPAISGELARLTTVESRHAAILAHIVGVTPFPNAADEPRSREEILTEIGTMLGA